MGHSGLYTTGLEHFCYLGFRWPSRPSNFSSETVKDLVGGGGVSSKRFIARLGGGRGPAATVVAEVVALNRELSDPPLPLANETIERGVSVSPSGPTRGGGWTGWESLLAKTVPRASSIDALRSWSKISSRSRLRRFSCCTLICRSRKKKVTKWFGFGHEFTNDQKGRLRMGAVSQDSRKRCQQAQQVC